MTFTYCQVTFCTMIRLTSNVTETTLNIWFTFNHFASMGKQSITGTAWFYSRDLLPFVVQSESWRYAKTGLLCLVVSYAYEMNVTVNSHSYEHSCRKVDKIMTLVYDRNHISKTLTSNSQVFKIIPELLTSTSLSNTASLLSLALILFINDPKIEALDGIRDLLTWSNLPKCFAKRMCKIPSTSC